MDEYCGRGNMEGNTPNSSAKVVSVSTVASGGFQHGETSH